MHLFYFTSFCSNNKQHIFFLFFCFCAVALGTPVHIKISMDRSTAPNRSVIPGIKNLKHAQWLIVKLRNVVLYNRSLKLYEEKHKWMKSCIYNVCDVLCLCNFFFVCLYFVILWWLLSSWHWNGSLLHKWLRRKATDQILQCYVFPMFSNSPLRPPLCSGSSLWLFHYLFSVSFCHSWQRLCRWGSHTGMV